MLRTSETRLVLVGLGLLTLLSLASLAEAQSHNDKHYQTLGVPKDASPRQIKKVRVRLDTSKVPNHEKVCLLASVVQ